MDNTNINYGDIKEFISGLRFKKALFGAREDTVYAAMQQLDLMYRSKIEGCVNALEQAQMNTIHLEEYANELDRVQANAINLEKQITELMAENETLRRRVAETADSGEKDKTDRIMRVIESLESVRENILVSAKAEAAEIVNQAKYDRILEEEAGRAEIKELQSMKQDAILGLKETKNKLHNVAVSLAVLQNEVDRQLEEETTVCNRAKIKNGNIKPVG